MELDNVIYLGRELDEEICRDALDILPDDFYEEGSDIFGTRSTFVALQNYYINISRTILGDGDLIVNIPDEASGICRRKGKTEFGYRGYLFRVG